MSVSYNPFPLAVEPTPNPGRGLALDEAGKIPTSVLPRTLTGRITGSSGATAAGTGFTSSRSSAGVYVITFTTAFAAAPVVVGNVIVAAGGSLTFKVQAVSASSATVFTGSDAGVGVDQDFGFLVVETK